MSPLSLSLGLSILLSLGGCGKNLFRSGVHKDPAEDATLALEKQNPDDAIAILQDALEADPGNSQYLSIMATAYALRAGVDPLVLGSKFATSSSNSSSGLALAAAQTDSITSLFSVMPEATPSVLSDIDLAVSILNQKIPVTQRQPGDVFKTAIYMMASLVLHTKALDRLRTGTLTADDIAHMSDADANAILNNLNGAVSLLASSAAASGVSTGNASQLAAQALTKYSAQIDQAPGDSKAEKLRNYLAAHPGAGAAAMAAQPQP